MRMDGYVVRETQAADEAGIQAHFEADPEYFNIVQSAPAGPSEFQSLITELAPGKTSDDKFVYSVVRQDGEIAAVIDLIRNFPEDGIWYIGLLFVECEYRRLGLGSQLVEMIYQHISEHGGHAIRIAVATQNEIAMKFWERAGFATLYEAERARPHATPLAMHVMEIKV